MPKVETGEGSAVTGSVPVTVGVIVGNRVGVEKLKMGVLVIGVILGKLDSSTGVEVRRGLGGLRQIKRKVLSRMHRTMAPQPNPPKRSLSKVGLNFSGNFIETTNSKRIRIAQTNESFILKLPTQWRLKQARIYICYARGHCRR